MKSSMPDVTPLQQDLSVSIATPDATLRKPLITRFGEAVDVRNRGTLKVGRFAGSQSQSRDTPAVVRIWTDDQCRELTAHQARALAAQLLEAASLAELQNNH